MTHIYGIAITYEVISLLWLGDFAYLTFKMTKKITEEDKKKIEKLVKQNGYNYELQDTYLREVLDEDKNFDDEFDIDWEV